MSNYDRIIRLSPQQQAVCDFVANGRGSAFVEAVAGAGKTTVLIEALKRTNGWVAFAAYNAKIAAEIKSKVAKSGHDFGNRVKIGTFHSFGLNAWRFVHKGVKYGPEEARAKAQMTADHLQIPKRLQPFVEKLVSLAKQRALGLYGHIDDVSEWYDIIDHFDMTYEIEDENEVAVGVELAIKALKHHQYLASDVIDFDDMIYMPVVTGCRMLGNDFVFVDECQPVGTLVSVPAGRVAGGKILIKQVPIENLALGDLVVSFNRETGAHVLSGKPVTKIKRRPYSGKLFKVKWGAGSTQYTPNHWCWVKCEELSSSYFVYLMKKGNQFRVGQCKGRWSDKKRSGLGFRLYEEKADALWLLSSHPDKASALVAETLVSIKFGLPMTRFMPNKRFNQEYTEGVWRNLVDNYTSGERCLEAFNREVDYPFMTKGSQQERDLTRPILMRASNLMTGMQMLSFNGASKHRKNDYRTVTVDVVPFEGEVVSLEIEDLEMYVADGLTTHNCQDTNPARRALARKMLKPSGRALFVGDRHQALYAFQGADNDSVDQIVKDFSCSLLPLTVTYRCPKAVVAAAREFVSHIEAAPEAPEGVVRHAGAIDIAKEGLTASDAILCRNTAPLVGMAYNLISQKISCHVEGKDIGLGLLKLVNKFQARNILDLKDTMEDYREKQVSKLMAKGKEQQAESISDRIATLQIIADRHTSVDAMRTEISTMFQDSDNNPRPTLTLCTVHRSKGREWDRVFILGRYEHMPSKYARQEYQLQQETNAIYVAYTRAMKELVLA